MLGLCLLYHLCPLYHLYLLFLLLDPFLLMFKLLQKMTLSQQLNSSSHREFPIRTVHLLKIRFSGDRVKTIFIHYRKFTLKFLQRTVTHRFSCKFNLS